MMNKMITIGFLLVGLVVLITLLLPNKSISSSEKRIAMDKDEKIKVFDVEKNAFVEVDRVVKTEEEWKQILDDEAFHIAREQGTEQPFSYAKLDNKEEGVYKCKACGNDLFLSNTKYESGTGWPSFYEPIAKDNVGEEEDNSLFAKRVEVHCNRCGAHLGHVFEDGPKPTGQRFCINGKVLKFKEAQISSINSKN